jgi:hypothetical protein
MTQSRYVVDSIQFDFVDGDFELPVQFHQGIINAALSTVYFADNEDEVVNQITESAGFCVSSINLNRIPSRY